MKKTYIASIILSASLTFSAAHAKEQVFLVCKTHTSSNLVVTAGCINAYNPTPTKVCTGKGDVCSTESLEDLCIKVGNKKGIDFQEFSSGLGTFKTEQACVDSCMREYDGRMRKFGAKCLKTISK